MCVAQDAAYPVKMNLLGLLVARSRFRLGAAALLLTLGACSDDGVPLASGAGADTDAAGSTSAATPSASGADPSAVTTADAATDPSATTDPSGPADTDSGPTPGTGDSSGGFTGGDASSSTQGGSDTDTETGGGEAECVADEDCQIVDDCCTCDAIPVGEEAPECEVLRCFAPTCAVEGAGSPIAAECRLGTCVVPELNCDQAQVVCNALPPKCSGGTLPTVLDGCWTDECVAAEHCDVVPSCESCGDDEVCVQNVDNGPGSFRCEPLPAACEGDASCDCMEAACEAPYDACGEGNGDAGLVCGCPAC